MVGTSALFTRIQSKKKTVSPSTVITTAGIYRRQIEYIAKLIKRTFELQFASPLSGRLNANGPSQCKAAPLLTRSDTEPLTVIILLDNFPSLCSQFMATT